MSQGVACSKCGASTPLPDDLRLPTFQCAFCGEQLATLAYAGRSAVSADEMRAHLLNVVSGGSEAGPVPRFEQHSTATRPGACVHCGSPIELPLDLQAKDVFCPSCKRSEPVRTYVSDGNRFMSELGRQMSGNQALAKLRAEGAPCSKCGGINAVPNDGSVQFVCSFCSAAILLSDFVPADAVARSRLKRGMIEVRAAAVDANRKRSLRVLFVVGGTIALVVAAAAVSMAIVGSGGSAPRPPAHRGR